MKIILLCYLGFIIGFGYSSDATKAKVTPDSAIRQLFAEYQNAVTSHDAKFPDKSFITDKEYQQLLDYVAKTQPNCIGDDESSFVAEINIKLYNDIITSKLVINKIVVNRIEYNFSCGNLLEIPRVVCTIRYAGNKIIEIPFLLVKTFGNQFKILKNSLNYKIFTNE